MDSDFFISLILCLLSAALICIFVNYINTERKKELDIISKTEGYQIYDHCVSFDERYYCYNYTEK